MRYGLRGGFGDQVVTDPVTGAVTVVTSAPITTDTVSSSGQNVYTDSSGTVVYAATNSSSGSLTDWLNQNKTMVMLGAAALLGLVLVAKAGR